MKQLIRKILKEETEQYQIVKKGIDVIISLAKKTYPFIVGWEKDGNWEDSTYYIYIDLVVDYKKAKEYYNLPLRSYYEKYPEAIEEIINNKERFAYVTSLLDFDKSSDEQYIESKKIKTFVEEAYELIPEEYKLLYKRESVFGDIVESPKEVSIMYYIFV